MDDCVFCKIVNQEIPSSKLYEDERFLAFLDIQPVSEGHMLIIPKEHIVWMQDAPDDIVGDIFVLTKKFMHALKKSIGCDYVMVSVVGTDVPHFHVHLMPRYLDDGFAKFPTRNFDRAKAEETIDKITRAL